jgi:NAD+ kinase
VRLSCGDDFVSEIKADGLIISSPTGSTAYNLAAGGPLLHPSVKGFSVTPIAPHSLTSRPFVVPDDEELKLQVNIPSGPGKSREAIPTAQLIVDGQLATDLKDGDELTISLNSSVHWMIQDPDRSFFILLREKLKFGDRA